MNIQRSFDKNGSRIRSGFYLRQFEFDRPVAPACPATHAGIAGERLLDRLGPQGFGLAMDRRLDRLRNPVPGPFGAAARVAALPPARMASPLYFACINSGGRRSVCETHCSCLLDRLGPKASAWPWIGASTACVTRFRDPLGRPLGLRLCPGSNGRPRCISPVLTAAAGGVSARLINGALTKTGRA